MQVRDLTTPYADAMAKRWAAENRRVEHEARMQNALEILSWFDLSEHASPRAAGQFVRATAREGLGR